MDAEYATLIDFGSTYTKVTCVSIPQQRVVMTGSFASTVHTDARIGMHRCFDAVTRVIGKQAFEASLKLSSSSAAGGLRMAVIGLTSALSISAGRNAAFGAGAKVMAVFSGRLKEADLEELEQTDAEIILLCGGYEKGNRSMVLHNAKMLSEARLMVPVIYAGNSDAAQLVRELFRRNRKECFLVDNIIPAVGEMNIGPAEEVIRHIFMKRIVNMKGMGAVQEEIGEILMPTPAAVLAAGSLLSEGTRREEGLGPMMMVDVGGATTDVYSFMKNTPFHHAHISGAPEPYAKRTVEGDMGMRESSVCVMQEVGEERMAQRAAVSPQRLQEGIDRRLKEHSILADSAEEMRIDHEIASEAVSISVRRHAGRLQRVYSKGIREIQYGKNLTEAPLLVGTGGVIVHAPDPDALLQNAVLRDAEDPGILIPRQLRTMVDHDYVFYAAGLLREYDEEAAFAIMKNSVTQC